MKKNILLICFFYLTFCVSKEGSQVISFEEKIRKINKIYTSNTRDSIEYKKTGKYFEISLNLHKTFEIPPELKDLHEIWSMTIENPKPNFDVTNIPKNVNGLSLVNAFNIPPSLYNLDNITGISIQNYQPSCNLSHLPKNIDYLGIKSSRITSLNIPTYFNLLNKVLIESTIVDTIKILGESNITYLSFFSVKTKYFICDSKSMRNLERFNISSYYNLPRDRRKEKDTMYISKGYFPKLKSFSSYAYFYEDWFIDYLGEHNVKVRMEDSMRVKKKYTIH